MGVEPLLEALLKLGLRDLRRIGFATATTEQVVIAATKAPTTSYIIYKIHIDVRRFRETKIRE